MALEGLDFDKDGDTDAVDLAILDEEEKKRKKGGNGKNSGCCVFLLAVGLPAALASWGLVKVFF
ncbi:MAG: hypothetical protein A2521_08555 [Deltaproteobacteria bacterium RIFOXYD12_FULL_57_12]|nr:MAG: hypothetical protein A2521_08555 [Deltaproteobacteria bacterium RIFOXYD12_FULL_57_12]